MTPRRFFLTLLPLGAACWLCVGSVALCAANGLLPHLLISLGAVFAYWRLTRRSYGYFD